MNIHVSYLSDEDGYRDAMAKLFWLSWGRIVSALIVCVLFGAIALHVWDLASLGMRLLIALLALGVAILLAGISRSLAEEDFLCVEYRFRTRDFVMVKTLRSDGKQTRDEIDYSRLRGITEYGDFFVLKMGSGIRLIVPKDSLSGSEEEQLFMAFIKGVGSRHYKNRVLEY